MSPEEAKQMVEDLNKTLVKRGILFLEVEVLTEEAADEIMQWMYGKEKPMKASLLQVAWDQALVPKEIYDAVKIISETALL